MMNLLIMKKEFKNPESSPKKPYMLPKLMMIKIRTKKINRRKKLLKSPKLMKTQKQKIESLFTIEMLLTKLEERKKSHQ